MNSTTVKTQELEVTSDMIRTIVETGGYTHPLFLPADASADHDTPLPGQGILLLMGGLLEQSGHLDHAIALVELTNVRFRKMVRAGMKISVTMTPGEQTTTSQGKLIQHYSWIVVNDLDEPIVEAHAVMLVHGPEGADD